MSFNFRALQGSFDGIRKKSDLFLDRFFNILLTDFPALRPYFENVDMIALKKQFLLYFCQIVDQSENPDQTKHILIQIGERHGYVGIKAIHFKWFKNALVSTLAIMHGPSWNDELQLNWEAFADFVTLHMMQGIAAVSTLQPTDFHQKKQAGSSLNQSADTVGGQPNLLPPDLRKKIRDTVSVAVESAVKAEVERVTREAFAEFDSERIVKFLKKAS